VGRPPIPLYRPSAIGHELANVRDALARGRLAGDGHYTRRAEAMLGEALGGARVLLTTSGTHALEMAALLLGLEPGDDVVVPAFTFVSTANAFVLRGARPIFADIRPDTLNLDERLLPAVTTARARAIVPMHYAGVACDMDAIAAFARARGLAVVEDDAHGLFGAWRGRPLGTCGALAALSFHETKNVTCGEGGALVVGDPALVERALIVREKGTDRSRFVRGEVDKYQWVDVGSSYVLSDLLAAFLCGQLEARVAIQARRRVLWERYRDELAAWAQRRGAQLPVIPLDCSSAWHLFHLVLPSRADREALAAHLADHGVQAAFHYPPLHLSPMGQRYGGRSGQCPVAERIAECLLRLPFFTALTDDEQGRVIDAVCAF
jgi:dTDP-4-amino-4,6-dideoxygalactose transaminase